MMKTTLKAILLFLLSFSYAKAHEAPQTVATIILQANSLKKNLTSVGTFTAYDDALLKAETSGRIKDVHFEDGGRVEADQKLFSLHNQEQEAQVKKAKATLAASQNTLRRKEELIKKEFVSHQDLEKAVVQVHADEASLALALASLEKTIVKAPFEGLVSERGEASRGSYVDAGSKLVRIQSLTPLRFIFHVPEKDLTSITVGDKVRINTDAYPGETFEGQVEAIESSVNEKNHSIKVYARFENKDERLLPGLYGRATIISVTQKPGVLSVPEKALLIRQEGAYVYKKVRDQAVLTVVKVGLRTADYAEILSGLRKGDEIILDGHKLQNGSKVITQNDKKF